jgi:hypothetical protein
MICSNCWQRRIQTTHPKVPTTRLAIIKQQDIPSIDPWIPKIPNHLTFGVCWMLGKGNRMARRQSAATCPIFLLWRILTILTSGISHSSRVWHWYRPYNIPHQKMDCNSLAFGDAVRMGYIVGSRLDMRVVQVPPSSPSTVNDVAQLSFPLHVSLSHFTITLTLHTPRLFRDPESSSRSIM